MFIFVNNSFLYSVPKSVLIAFIVVPYINIKCSTIAFAIVCASLFGVGIMTMYLLRSHCIVTAYLLLFIVLTNGPTVSILIISNGLSGVVVLTNFSQVFFSGFYSFYTRYIFLRTLRLFVSFASIHILS